MKHQLLRHQINTLPHGTLRISIIGCAGTGKSTLARLLGQSTGLPVIHLDRIFWKPNWQSISIEDMNQQVREKISGPAWIIDGNYSRTIPEQLEASDVVIFLDFPRVVSLYYVFKRRLVYHNRSRSDMAEDCKEKIDMEFLKWVWNFNESHRSRYLQTLAAIGKPVVILESRRQVTRFIDSLKLSS